MWKPSNPGSLAVFGQVLAPLEEIFCLVCRSGQVTQKMLDAPDKRLFIGIGGLEAASQLLGFVGASKLPGHSLCWLHSSSQ